MSGAKGKRPATFSDEAGAITRHNFKYQDAIGISLLLSPEWGYTEVLCEEGDDFLALSHEGEWHAIQVKTSTGERRWRLNDEAVVQSLRNFARLHTGMHPSPYTVARFLFVSNLPADDLPSRAASSPVLLTQACREFDSAGELPEDYAESLTSLAEKTGVPGTTLFEVLRRTRFALGLERRTFDEQLFRTLSARRAMLPGHVIQIWLEKLFVRFAEASATPGPRYETLPRECRIGHEILEETLAEVLQTPNAAVEVLARDLQQARASDGSVENFLSHYLGSDRVPRTFAGREGELEELDQWLESDSPYCLLTANAAIGKSALVVAWSSRIAARADTDLIFYPVSHRFQTNGAAQVFRSLYGKLSAILGKTNSSIDHPGFTNWRSDFAGLLRQVGQSNRKVILIVDGLDEALDWHAAPDLFPLDPPANLKVLVAARPLAGDSPGRDWITRLGWSRRHLAEHLEIANLKPDAVKKCVHAALPQVAEDDCRQLAAELARLTSGDPLLLQFYLEIITHDAMTGQTALEILKQLHRAKPGYEAFIDALFARRPGIEEHSALFTALACALGPIGAEDLRALHLPVPDLDALDIGLRRLLVGELEKGLALSHPKLVEYFRAYAGAAACEGMEGRLITWCQRVVDALKGGKLGPGSVSRYVLRYYGVHLEKAGNTAALAQLVDDQWADAWLAAEVSNDGFLIDVRRAWDSLVAWQGGESEPANLPAFVNLALIVARCQLPPVSPELFQVLLREGVWTNAKAYEYAQAHHRDEFYEHLAADLPEERIIETLQGLLDKRDSYFGLAGRISPRRARIVSLLLRRLLSEQRRDILDLYLGRTEAETVEPERTLAMAYYLEFLDEAERARVLKQVRDLADGDGNVLPFFFHEILPITARICGRDSELFRRLTKRSFHYALELGANPTSDQIEGSLQMREEWGSVPGRMLETYQGLLEWLPEDEWIYAVQTAERLIQSSESRSKTDSSVNLLVAALPAAPGGHRESLASNARGLLTQELNQRSRARLLHALTKAGSSPGLEYAEALADLAIGGHDGELALDAIEVGGSLFDPGIVRQLLQIAKADEPLPFLEEEHFIRLLSFVSAEEKPEILSKLISGQSRSVGRLNTSLARYALESQIDPASSRRILLEVREWDYTSRRDFFCDAAWLPFEQNFGELLATIEGWFLDKVYEEALGYVFARASRMDRRAFILDCFGLEERGFPTTPREFKYMQFWISMAGGSVNHLYKKIPCLVPFWPEEAWPTLLELLSRHDSGEVLESVASYAPASFRPPLREIVSSQLEGSKRERILAILELPPAVPPLLGAASDPFERFVSSIPDGPWWQSVLEPFRNLKEASNIPARMRHFEQCLDATSGFYRDLATNAFLFLADQLGKLPLQSRASLLASWLAKRADSGWDGLMIAIANSAPLLKQAGDEKAIFEVISSIDRIEPWFEKPTN